MAPWTSTDCYAVEADHDPGLVTGVVRPGQLDGCRLTAFAVRFDGAAGTTVSLADEAAWPYLRYT